MPNRIVFRPRARQDLLDIHLYIARNSSLRIANSFVERIEAICLGLANFPRKGVARDDLAPGIRTLAMSGSVLIAYRVEDQAVRIVRIISAGRDMGEELFS